MAERPLSALRRQGLPDAEPLGHSRPDVREEPDRELQRGVELAFLDEGYDLGRQELAGPRGPRPRRPPLAEPVQRHVHPRKGQGAGQGNVPVADGGAFSASPCGDRWAKRAFK